MVTLEIEDQDSDLDKSIASVEIVELESTYVALQINFGDTMAISQSLIEPDTLIATIEKPEIFIDAETGQPLAIEPIEYRVVLSAQFTATQFKALLENADTAAKISIGVTILELGLIFLFKKILFSMWVLILTLQFFVFISFW